MLFDAFDVSSEDACVIPPKHYASLSGAFLNMHTKREIDLPQALLDKVTKEDPKKKDPIKNSVLDDML